MKVVLGGLGRPWWVVGAVWAVLLAGGGCEPQSGPHRSTPAGSLSSPNSETLPADRVGLMPLPADAQAARVEHHTDGDTLAVRAYARGSVLRSTSQITVRLLEIDTPELRQSGGHVECYGPQASAHLATLAPVGAKVYVTADKDRTDPYGRDLLYLWDVRGRSINLALVEGGFAKAVLYEPNDRYIAVLRAAEATARAARRGLWGACAGSVPLPLAAPAPATTIKPAPAPARTATGPAPAPANCDAAYPSVCIPPGPPDLDCGDIDVRRFAVLVPDPHRFDADHDGMGCESG